MLSLCRSQWPRGLRRRSSATRSVEIFGSNPTGVMDVSLFECCVLSGGGLCDELITRPEESYRLWRVDVCDLEKQTLVNEDESQDPLRGYRAKKKKVKCI